MRSAICLAATLALAPIGVQATTTDNLADLFGNNGSLATDRFVVHGWSLDANNSDPSVSIDFSQIIVDIVGSGSIFTLNYNFGGQMAVTGGDSIYLDFSYYVTDRLRPHFVENVLELTDPLFGGTSPDSGYIAVDEEVFCGDRLVGQKHTEINPDAGVNTRSDSAKFLCKRDLWIEKRIQLVSEGSSVSLGDMHQTFVPVPATAALLAFGMAGLRRRARQPGAER